MQFPRRLLLISCAAILLTIVGLKPLATTVHSAQFSTFQQKAANENHSPQITHFEGSKSNLDPQHFEDISRVLSMIKTGQKTLHLIAKYEIGVGFELGEGSRFYPSQNQVIIDSEHGHFSAAIILIHEVTHAHLFHKRLAADLNRNDRQTYVQKKMEEESYAIAASIEAMSELWEIGVDISSLLPPIYYPYKQAYGSAFRAAKYDYPGLDEETLQSIGRTAGQEAVLEAIIEGQVMTSIDQRTYTEYWGSVWDEKSGL